MILIALGLVLTELGLVARDLRDQRMARGGPLPTPTALPFLGISADLIHVFPSELTTVTSSLAAAGFGWVRIRLPWNEIEAEPGVYQWARADAAVNAARAAGLTPILLIDGAPLWARAPVDQTTADGHLAPPADLVSFAAFAQAVAGRYQDQVRHYQIWDEPNIAPHWGARHINAVGYAQLLKVAAHAIRSADPDARILLAALAPTVDRGHLAQDEAYFLQRLYAAGAVGDFDFVALQPFGFATRPDEPTVDNLRLNFNRVKLVRDLMIEAGDGDTPIWLMRYGWNRLPGSPWQAVSPDHQRDYAVAALDLAYTSWPWVVAQGWADAGVALVPDDPRRGFALTPNLVTAFQAWRTRAAQPRNAAAAPLPVGAWLPLMGWFALTLALLARGIVLLRRLPWTLWRASLSRRSPYWLIVSWGALLVVYYLATWPPLILLCWLAAALLIYLRPPLGLALALVLIPFHDYHKEFVWVDLRWTVPPTQALLFCLLPAAFLYKTGRILRDRWDGLAFAWLGIALLGITGAWYTPGFRQGLLELVLLPLLVFVLLRLWATTPHTIALYTAALAAGGALAAVVGLGDWLQGGGTLADGIRRLTAPTFSPNQTALYLVRSLFLLLGLMMATKGWRRWAWCGALSVTTLALVLTGSRGGLLLGLPAGALVWFGLRAPQGLRRWTWLHWLLGMALLLLVGWLWGARLGNLATVGFRLEGWLAALQLWLDYPWFGVGPNGFWYRFPAYLPIGSTLDADLRHPHNIWLEVATGGGIAALLWLGLAITAWVRWTRQYALTLRATQLGLLAGLAAGLAHSQVDAFQALPDLAIWNWAVPAIILAGHAYQQKAAIQTDSGLSCETSDFGETGYVTTAPVANLDQT